MKYELAKVMTENSTFKSNNDGTITVSNVVVYTKIVDAYPGKFQQVDIMSNIIIPASETSATQPEYIETQATAWVAATYPNT
jgi:hypothetical protein